jgi:hypothetical protein
LEADRLAALALSEQKAEEAKLIKARQEGFQAALEILGGEVPVRHAEADPETPARRRQVPLEHQMPLEQVEELAEADPQTPRRRRGRRPIPQMILRELSFCGQPMTVAQIARAIEYDRELTETALKRMEKDGQVIRNKGGPWTTGITDLTHINWHPGRTGNGKSREPVNM